MAKPVLLDLFCGARPGLGRELDGKLWGEYPHD